jgi:hypothetical protein
MDSERGRYRVRDKRCVVDRLAGSEHDTGDEACQCKQPDTPAHRGIPVPRACVVEGRIKLVDHGALLLVQ